METVETQDVQESATPSAVELAAMIAAGKELPVEITPLRRLQLVELDLMVRMDELFKQLGLRYFMLGGTLLGSIRHDGFIPWDDDVDVGIPRPDLDAFLKYVEEHPESLQRPDDACNIGVISLYNDMSCRQGMVKITSDAVKLVNRSADEERYEDAWIDLIPMDGFPAPGLKASLAKMRLTWWKGMDALTEFDYVVDTKRDRGFKGNLFVKTVRAFSKVFHPYGKDFHKVLIKWDNSLRKYDYDAEPRSLNMFAATGFDELFVKADLGVGQPQMFEGRIFVAPDNIPAILNCIYGPDYMTPPPEDQRNWHNTEILGFGK